MNYRLLGATGLRVSEIGLGCSSLGSSVFDDNSAASREVLERAFERGVTFFDTAANYGYGSSERLIGELLKGRRDKAVIATKGGHLTTTLGRFGKLARPAIGPFRRLVRPFQGTLKQKAKHRQDFSPAHLTQALEGSLKRLQTDYVDLYQLHSPPADVVERGEVFETLERLKEQGKIRFYGASVAAIEVGMLCLRHAGVAALQVPFNLLQREAAEVLLPKAKAGGVGIVSRVPFGRGLLTGAGRVSTGLRTDDPRLAADAATERARLSFLIEDGRRTWISAALRFVLSHEDISTVIPGTKSLSHLEENLRAGEAAPFSEEEMRRIRAA
jgi:aryl-alcohol dehydrogenase-like predicted oxidoreductase